MKTMKKGVGLFTVVAIPLLIAVGCSDGAPTDGANDRDKGLTPNFDVQAPLDHAVTQASILALIAGPPAATAGLAFTFDLQGDFGIIQSAAWPMADGNFLYGYQWECHTGPNWDILTIDVPMAGSTPVLRDIDGDGTLDDSWAITDITSGLNPYDQSLVGLQALCGSDIFGVSVPDFVTGFNFSGPNDEVTFSNLDGIFLSSNLFGFIGCTAPQVVNTTSGGGDDFGTEVIFTTEPYPIVAPSGPCVVRRMTGGGSFSNQGGARFTHGFQLHCDANQGPNNLEINWPKNGKGSNRFHLESLTSATCSDDGTIEEKPPVAGFDTYVGSGFGRLNGDPGHAIDFTFTDAGEPGKNVDLATIDIDGGTIVVSGTLNRGNHQAHQN